MRFAAETFRFFSVYARYDYLLNSLKLKQAAGTLKYADLAQVGGWFTPVSE